MKFTSFDNYIAALPRDVQDTASLVRETIASALPGANEAIKYNIPAFQLNGKSIIYFAVWKKHVGLYPVYKGTDDFERIVAPYRVKKDTVQFALNKAMPTDIIVSITKSQLRQTKS